MGEVRKISGVLLTINVLGDNLLLFAAGGRIWAVSAALPLMVLFYVRIVEARRTDLVEGA